MNTFLRSGMRSGYPPFYRIFITVFFFLLISGGFAGVHAVESTSFSWLANPPEDNVIGYRLYYGSASRFNPNLTLKADFSYDYYIDFAESKRCVDDGTDANCQDLDPDDIQCENLNGEAPLCSVKKLQGLQYFAMTAYNAQAESDFTPELSVRYDGADPWNIAVLSAINTLLLEKNK